MFQLSALELWPSRAASSERGLRGPCCNASLCYVSAHVCDGEAGTAGIIPNSLMYSGLETSSCELEVNSLVSAQHRPEFSTAVHRWLMKNLLLRMADGVYLHTGPSQRRRLCSSSGKTKGGREERSRRHGHGRFLSSTVPSV